MKPQPADDELLIEDVPPELLRRLEERATANGRTVEEEVRILLEIGLSEKHER